MLLVAALFCISMQAVRADTATDLYARCRNQQTTAEQRECYPAAIRQSELELSAAEKGVRAALRELEAISPGSQTLHPVRAFDKAKRAFRLFRDVERRRVLTSYGSGNGGDLAAAQAVIEMNLERVKALKGQAAPR
ncbi:MAG: DUF1311 domain-containing protein [Proteobacteria bacterium]|nr:DUF1311 domain-containing protein [Pseudomonadota bacterium]